MEHRLHRDHERSLTWHALAPPCGQREGFFISVSMKNAIEFHGVARQFGDVRAVDEVSFTVREGEFFSMLGPSGSGKTTCLRLIAGFELPDRGRITISLAHTGKFVILTVDDNGPGIRADNIDRIFERFYTDRPTGEAFGQNSGLGLSISRQIVEAHGGTLTAENIPGTKPGEIKGARFVVTLPAEGG